MDGRCPASGRRDVWGTDAARAVRRRKAGGASGSWPGRAGAVSDAQPAPSSCTVSQTSSSSSGILEGALAPAAGGSGPGRLGPCAVERQGTGRDPGERRGAAPRWGRIPGRERRGHRLGPLPVALQRVGGHPQALHGEAGEELRVLEPQPLAPVVGEEVAVERAARGLVGLGAHEAGERRGPRHPALGEPAPHLPGLGPEVPGAQLLVDRPLPRGVGGHGERLQGVEVARAVGVEECRGGVAEPQRPSASPGGRNAGGAQRVRPSESRQGMPRRSTGSSSRARPDGACGRR